MRWLRRLAYWLRFSARQDDLREELAFHHASRASDFERQGLSPDAAHAAARRVMGNDTYMREEARGVWLSYALDATLKDWSHAWRALRRAPVFTSVVVLTLALAIGANTAIFTAVHHLLLAPLPYRDGNRIVALESASASDPSIAFGVNAAMVRNWRARSRTLDEFSAGKRRRYRLGDDGGQDTVSGAAITPSFLPMLRVQPAVGRGFTNDDARLGAAPVAIIGHGLWQLRYGGEHDAVGRVLKLNGIPRTIVGVMPLDVDIPMSDGMKPDVWLPLNMDSASGQAFARLRPGVTSDLATRELQMITKDLPDSARRKGMLVRAQTAQDRIEPGKKRAIGVLFIAVGGLLLIACANIGNLLLMRTWRRQREFAVRQALGAGRLRLARQLFAESLALAVLGGLLGLLIAWGGLRVIVSLRPRGLSDLERVHIDATVLLWTVAISLAVGLLFGVGPAVLSGGPSMTDALRAGIRTAMGTQTGRRFRSGLVVVEIALSLIFLVAAGLLVQSFRALARAPIGYDPNGLVAVSVRLAYEPAAADRAAIAQTLVRSLASVPGVRESAFGSVGLPQMNVRADALAIEGPTDPQPVDISFVEVPFVGSNYFRVTGIPLIQGRTFDTDGVRASREVVVNQSLARRLWPEGRALGSGLRVGNGAGAIWLTVVAIAGDRHLPGTSTLPGANGDLYRLQMYRPTSAAPEFVNTVVLRIKGNAGALEPTLKRAIESAGISAKLGSVNALEPMLDSIVLSRPRFALVLFGLFAVIALVLSAVGLYAIIAYAVTQRTREIGIRVALGASSGIVARLILSDSFRLVIAGGCVGLLGAYATTRTLATFLYQISPTDPIVFGAVALLLAAVALIASLVPMRRALRIDPVDALRAD